LDASDSSGAAEVADALRSNTTITELSLGDRAMLDETTAAAIAGTLRVNKFISSIGGGGLEGGSLDPPSPSPFGPGAHGPIGSHGVNGGNGGNGSNLAPRGVSYGSQAGPGRPLSSSAPASRLGAPPTEPPPKSPEPNPRASSPRPSPPQRGSAPPSVPPSNRGSFGTAGGYTYGLSSGGPATGVRAVAAPLPTPEPNKSRAQKSTSERYRAAGTVPGALPGAPPAAALPASLPTPGGGSRLHDIVITNIVWCMASPGRVGVRSYIAHKSRILLQQCGSCKWAGVIKGELILAHTITSERIS